ncbi:ribosome-inactivating family protein [Streptomyces sp. NPDC006372]|uniref:ribosome-inactivating family protein n=1 Tax=Streptomyces sp. NPDC006372 TaxID=3155599 RepID=UPI0033AD3D2B
MIRKLCAALLALAMSMGLVTSLSSTASAANYQVVDYNISNITAGGMDHALAYYHVIDAIHRLSYGEPTEERSIAQTTQEQGRIIQVRIRDTGGNDLVSIYIWANTLYVAGFYAARGGGHYVFNDGREAEFEQTLGIARNSAERLGRTGNYTGLPTGNNRESLTINPQAIYGAASTLGYSRGYNDNVGRALVVMIQTFSEAARFGRVMENVYYNIYHPGNTEQMGALAGLQNQWRSISQFARDLRSGYTPSITVLGTIVRSFEQLRQRLSFVELLGSVALL